MSIIQRIPCRNIHASLCGSQIIPLPTSPLHAPPLRKHFTKSEDIVGYHNLGTEGEVLLASNW